MNAENNTVQQIYCNNIVKNIYQCDHIDAQNVHENFIQQMNCVYTFAYTRKNNRIYAVNVENNLREKHI